MRWQFILGAVAEKVRRQKTVKGPKMPHRHHLKKKAGKYKTGKPSSKELLLDPKTGLRAPKASLMALKKLAKFYLP